MPQPYEFDTGHADGIRHADLDAGERVLREMIYECQRSLEGIEHAKLPILPDGYFCSRSPKTRATRDFSTFPVRQ